jgi:hypothetical protein
MVTPTFAGLGVSNQPGAAQPPTIGLIWLDGGYANSVDASLIDWADHELGVRLEVVKRNDDVKGFQLLPRRWVVERVRREALIDRVEVRDHHLRPVAAG